MTTKKLAQKIALIEGKKSQARIGDVMEILSIFKVIMYSPEEAEAVCEWLNEEPKKKKVKK